MPLTQTAVGVNCCILRIAENRPGVTKPTVTRIDGRAAAVYVHIAIQSLSTKGSPGCSKGTR